MNMSTFAPAIRILLLMGFMRLSTMGYFTPQQASEFTKLIMDFLTLGSPIAWAMWATWNNRPAAIVEKADALPGVKAVVTDTSPAGKAIAEAVASPTVNPERNNPGVGP